VLITGRGHRFARRKRIAFADTLAEDMVGMHHGSTLQSFLQQQAEKLGKPMKLRIQFVQLRRNVPHGVGGGVGVAIVPESAARRNLKPQKLAQIELSDAWRVRERYILVRDLAAAAGVRAGAWSTCWPPISRRSPERTLVNQGLGLKRRFKWRRQIPRCSCSTPAQLCRRLDFRSTMHILCE
jgi:hypothetical protein